MIIFHSVISKVLHLSHFWKGDFVGRISTLIVIYYHGIEESEDDCVSMTVVSQHYSVFLFYFLLKPRLT